MLPLAVPDPIHEDATPAPVPMHPEPNLPPELVSLWMLLLE